MILATAGFVIASTTFRPSATLPLTAVYGHCGGANVSPELHWRNAPRATRSFALTVFDPDAAAGWYHWVAYNLPARTNALRAGVTLPASEAGTTSFKETAYGGPCPPPGKVHHYIFTLYALNVARLPGTALTGPELEAAMRGHVTGRASITGLYSR